MNVFAHLQHTKTGTISGYIEDVNVTEPVALLKRVRVVEDMSRDTYTEPSCVLIIQVRRRGKAPV
jgi:hypothetical protein